MVHPELHKYERYACWLLLGILLLISIFLRGAHLGSIPLPADEDELSYIYDSYSIAETGQDRSGAALPILDRGFGTADSNPAFFSWLVIIPLRLFGFSLFSGRLVSACAGIITIVLLYFLVKDYANKYAALLAVLFLAISPWHLLNSRIAHQGTALPALFTVFILLIWQKAISRRYSLSYIGLLGFCIGFYSNIYIVCRLTALIMLIIALFDLCIYQAPFTGALWIKKILVLLSFAFLAAMPGLYAMVSQPDGFFARAHVVLAEAVPLKAIPHNFLSYLNPRFLFDSYNHWDVENGPGVSYIEWPFLYLGITLMMFGLRKKGSHFTLIILGVYAASLAAPSLAVENPQGTRASAIIPILAIFSAMGAWGWIYFLTGKLRVSFLRAGAISKELLLVILICVAGLANAAVLLHKVVPVKEYEGDGRNHGYVLASVWLGNQQGKYDKIYIDNFDNMIYMYIIFYSGITPSNYHSLPKVIDASGPYDKYHQIGKYYFEDVKSGVQRTDYPGKYLFVTKNRLLPGLNEVHCIEWLGDKFHFYE